MEPLTTSQYPLHETYPLLDHTVGQLLVERAAQHGTVEALVGVGHDGASVRHTYAELLHEARRVAGALVQITDPGDFVALWAPNVAEWPVIQYGAALAGVVLVALNPVLRDSELEYALRHSGSTVLLHADRSRDYDLRATAEQVAPRCPALRHVISLSEHSRWQGRALPIDDARVPSDPDAAVMLQYTSGTTGNPKGVLLRHRSLVNVARLTLDTVGVEDGASTINPLPMFHTAGCVIATLGPLWKAGKVVLVDRFDPVPVLRQMRAESVSVLFYVPTILGALIAAQRASTEPTPALHTAMGGAATVSASMIEAAGDLFGASVTNLFGQTELAPVLTATLPTDSRADQLDTVGHPLPQVECRIVDPATGQVAALGEPGEICARGYQQMIEYLYDPQATAAAVDADGFLHTGDLGTMDERGYVRITGRLKDIIIRGGENIAPAEIETCLLNHPAVAEAAVFALPDDHFGEQVAAAVRLQSDTGPDVIDALITHCRTRLAPYKTPARWFVVDQMPVTPTGKVQKFRLRHLVDSDELTDVT